MALYVKTLHLMNNTADADAFNDLHAEASEIYHEDYAFAYGSHLVGVRFENLAIEYDGPRNARYETEIAQLRRNDIHRSFGG